MSITDYDSPYTGGDVVLERRHDGMACANVPHARIRHSPAGFEWGYGGSGPADLALNILLAVTGDRDFAEAPQNYQRFKEEIICTMPQEGGRIPRERILDFYRGHHGEDKEPA